MPRILIIEATGFDVDDRQPPTDEAITAAVEAFGDADGVGYYFDTVTYYWEDGSDLAGDNTGHLAVALDSLHPNLAAAIGHVMRFAYEDMSGDPITVDPALSAAVESFYPIAQVLAARHTNIEPDEAPEAMFGSWDCTIDPPDWYDRRAPVSLFDLPPGWYILGIDGDMSGPLVGGPQPTEHDLNLWLDSMDDLEPGEGTIEITDTGFRNCKVYADYPDLPVKAWFYAVRDIPQDERIRLCAERALADWNAGDNPPVTTANLFDHDGLTCDLVGHHMTQLDLAGVPGEFEKLDEAVYRALLAIVPLPTTNEGA